MKALELINVLRDIAPEHLAEKWDKVGLHVGRYEQNVRRALLCIDLTEAVLDEAIKKKCQMIVAYHPPIFNPIERLVADDDPQKKNSWKQTLLVRLIEAGIAVYSPHTALDAVRGGINDWLCDGLGKERDERLTIGIPPEWPSNLNKVVVFVPENDLEPVRKAMAEAGAGSIGNYDLCSFSSVGVGTFRPGPNTNPTFGKQGKLEHVIEHRLEMICNRSVVPDVIRAAKRAHSYEEPAIDTFRFAPTYQHVDEEQTAGRMMVLSNPVSPQTLVRRIKSRLRLSHVKIALPTPSAPNRKADKVEYIAVCVGAGGSLFEKASFCDVYITGEMQHHQVLDLQQRGAVVILAGHTNTERPFLPTYRDMIEDRLPSRARKSLQIEVSEADKSPMSRA